MNHSIVKQLIRKDLQIMKIPAMLYWLGGILSIVIAITGGDTSGLVAMILFVAALFGAGVHAAFQCVVQERKDQTLAFIMSLPVTVKEYTTAKIAANLLLIGGVWITLSAASYIIFIGESMPVGAVPFVTIILVAIFFAYILVLATTLIFETEAAAITAIVAANLGTQAVLWWLSDLHGIRSVIGGQVAVWNSTVLTTLGCQFGLIGLLLVLTFYLQSRKTAFV